MSKTGAWYLDMQEDAGNLTKDEFIKKHGEHNLDLWNEVHEELGDLEEMQSKLKDMQSRFNKVVSRMNKSLAGKILKND
tara:strand:+ start:192 stop:428 length:237 start_codon:yes stop_codon:yes gene_type:complete